MDKDVFIQSYDLVTQRKATEKSWSNYQEYVKSEWGLVGLDTGIHPLNMVIGGWIPGKVTTLAARSGHGKSASIIPILDAALRVEKNRRLEVLLMSWEMSSDVVVDRYISFKTGINSRMLKQGAKLLTKEDKALISDAYKQAGKLPVVYQQNSTNIDHITNMVDSFVKRCREMSKIEKKEVHPLVIIDYIGMAQFSNAKLRTYGIGDFMNGCKQLANKYGISVYILAQINRSSDDKVMPTRSDLSDSQSIENASDNLVIWHRPEYNGLPSINTKQYGPISSHKVGLMKVVKCRDFGIDDVILNCDIGLSRFWQYDTEFDHKYWEDYKKEQFWLDHFKLKKAS